MQAGSGKRKNKKGRFISGPYRRRVLYGAGNLTTAQAAGAGVYSFRRTVHNRLDAADVGLPRAVGTTMGVRNLDAESNTLSANITFSHLLHLL